MSDIRYEPAREDGYTTDEAPVHAVQAELTLSAIETMIREHGSSSRTFKSALIWAVPEGPDSLQNHARNLLAWELIDDEFVNGDLRLDSTQQRQLKENIKRAGFDLSETVWRTYKNIVLLGKDNALQTIDLGLVHSSAANSMLQLILSRLEQDGEIAKTISPSFLRRHWAQAFTEWSTSAIRDAFFASPVFPRLTDPDAIKDTIARGVQTGTFAYVGKTAEERYEPFYYKRILSPFDVEISDEMYIVPAEIAEAYLSQEAGTDSVGTLETIDHGGSDSSVQKQTGGSTDATKQENDKSTEVAVVAAKRLNWEGVVPPQKWMNFYTKILSKFAPRGGLTLTVKVEVKPEGGLSQQDIDETSIGLRDLGLDGEVDAE